jgi:mono/diheme cytochrome c family protein
MNRINVYILLLITGILFYSCVHAGKQENNDENDASADRSSVSFDGSDYKTNEEKVLHGKRLSTLFACNDCHMPDYTGVHFGDFIPLLDGLWATNISLTMPTLSDEQLEKLLRDGTHPERDLFLMPSKTSQFLSKRDMDAMIAYLRTIPDKGSPTPNPPAGFRDSVTARLPADYWRTDEYGRPSYHTAEDEVMYYRSHSLPNLGKELLKGRLIAQTMCSSCHGASLDGIGEDAADIRNTKKYDTSSYKKFLTSGITVDGDTIITPFGSEHMFQFLTDNEIESMVAYMIRLIEVNRY